MIIKLPMTTQTTTALALRTVVRNRRFLPFPGRRAFSAAATANAVPKKWSSSSDADDFTSFMYISANSATMESEWWMQQQQIAREDVQKLQSVLEQQQQQQQQQPHNDHDEEELLYKLQLQSCPESAIGYAHVGESMSESTQQDFLSVLKQKGLTPNSTGTIQQQDEEIQLDLKEMDRMIQYLQLSAPESAVGFVHVGEMLTPKQKEQLQSHYKDQGKDIPDALLPTTHQGTTPQEEEENQLLQQMLLSSCPESAIGYTHAGETLTDTMKNQWLQSQQQSPEAIPATLPKTFEEAMQITEQRPIVVTTTTPPFRVVRVNAEWEGLCGYTQEEAYDKPIGDLLNTRAKETETDTNSTRDAGRRMVQSLKTNPTQPQSALLINYTKEGRKFYNRLQVGPLVSKSENQEAIVVEYLVGVLQEVQQQEAEGAMQQQMKA